MYNYLSQPHFKRSLVASASEVVRHELEAVSTGEDSFDEILVAHTIRLDDVLDASDFPNLQDYVNAGQVPKQVQPQFTPEVETLERQRAATRDFLVNNLPEETSSVSSSESSSESSNPE
ncbi:hypothetical protein [Capybara microvirus Cap3_SP_344]|nr:hypothetical protein [Capybara microvirus Cap3_SP_344]